MYKTRQKYTQGNARVDCYVLKFAIYQSDKMISWLLQTTAEKNVPFVFPIMAKCAVIEHTTNNTFSKLT